eukprot:UN08487
MHMIRIRCLKYLFDLLVVTKKIMISYISRKIKLKIIYGYFYWTILKLSGN